MHYYSFHVGDYIHDTAHLSNEEDLAFRRLLDLYYTQEKPIPNKTLEVARRIRMGKNIVAVQTVLEEFFMYSQEHDFWFHKRCDETIAAYQAKAERNREVGKLGGRPKSNPQETQAVSKHNPNQEPITNNHIKESKDSLSAGLPTCPHQDILNLYKKHLPQLAQPRVWDGVRQTNLRQRWLQAAKPSIFSPKGYSSQAEGLAWWDSFFGYIANDTKLAQGFETKDRTWRPDLVWIVNANNFAKIIDGKYQK